MAEKRQSTRRDFLKGKAAADRVVDLADQAWQSSDSGTGPVAEAIAERPAADGPAYLVEIARRAMACQFQILLNAGQYPQGTEAAMAALDLIEELEDQLSVYREHSELSYLNHHAADEPMEVEAGLFHLLEQALEIYRDTGGAFDITASPLSRAWGFFRRAGKVPSQSELDEARSRVGSQHVRLDARRQTVAFGKPGMELSLNSIGKGYAVDRAGALLQASGVNDFLLHGGQSSVLAAGSRGAQPGTGWTIGLRHPLRPTLRLAEFQLEDCALATSGSGTQFFHHRGKRYGHLLDPRTGQPASGVYSATAVAPSAALADALATAMYVMGPELAREYCGHHKGIFAILVVPGGRSGTIKLHSAGSKNVAWRKLDGEGASFA